MDHVHTYAIDVLSLIIKIHSQSKYTYVLYIRTCCVGIEGIFEGVELLWMLKIWIIYGKKIVVYVRRKLKLTETLTCMSKYVHILWFTSKPQNHHFYPLEQYPLYGVYAVLIVFILVQV